MKYILNLYKAIIIILLISASLFILLVIGAVLFTEDTNEGRVYRSKDALCIDFAQSYLKTITKESNYNEEKWSMAIDVETDLYKLCQTDLNEESLKNFQFSGLKKYK